MLRRKQSIVLADILPNAIYCGNEPPTRRVCQEFAPITKKNYKDMDSGGSGVLLLIER